MSSLPINHQTRTHGFTLTELMVSMAVVGAVSLVMIGVLVSTMKLSSENVVTNVSNYRARQTLDRLGEIVRYAADTPDLITSAGAITTASTADGILVKNALLGTYIFRSSSGKTDDDIPSGATSFYVEYPVNPSSDVLPRKGDYFLLSLSTQPELEVASVGSVTTSGSISKVLITTTTGITEVAKPSSYSVWGSRYRKEAYLFAQAGSQWTLRHYSRVVASTNYGSATNFTVLGVGFQKMGTQAWFTTTTDNGTQATWLRAIARSSDHAEYVENENKHNTLTTMPIQVKLWNYNAPPPPAS